MDFLQIQNGAVVRENGEPIRLRGTNIGAWMNMENFMNGMPGSEHRMRETARQTLGEEMGSWFFTSMLSHFFTEQDVRYMKSLGMNFLRIPLNYRWFEDDMAPYVYKEEGFAMLDTALDWCEKYEVYAVLDLHAVQGWQSSDWHCDISCRTALFWRMKDFQERYFALWKVLAARYKDRSVVAGYDIMNEPCTMNDYGRLPLIPYQARWKDMNAIYRRVTEEIRSVDPRHILIIEGDDYSRRFCGLDAPWDENLMISSHAYTTLFDHPEITSDQGKREYLRKEFLESEGYKYSTLHNVPLWVSEFSFLPDQVEVYEENNVHWTTWSLKGCDDFFLLSPKKERPYRTLTEPVARKALICMPEWGGEYNRTLREQLNNTADLLKKTVDYRRFDNAENPMFFMMTVGDVYYNNLLQYPYIELFQGMDREEIDAVMADFDTENCAINTELEDRFRKYCL